MYTPLVIVLALALAFVLVLVPRLSLRWSGLAAISEQLSCPRFVLLALANPPHASRRAFATTQERSGALGTFLNQMAEAAPHERYWNVSLFHYRNHGADIGTAIR